MASERIIENIKQNERICLGNRHDCKLNNDENHISNAFNCLNSRTVERNACNSSLFIFQNKCLEGEIVNEYDKPVKR